MSAWSGREGVFVEERLRALGLRHGLAGRRLGDMKEPAARARAARAVGVAAPLTLRQVHGTLIHRADPGRQGAEGDGWVLDRPGLTVGIYAADCLPLYLWTEDGRVAGLFHAGWRGLAAGMPEAAVSAVAAAAGVHPRELLAAAGPHAGACCYRVGGDLKMSFPESSFVHRDGELFLDLAAETRRRLLDAGLRPERARAEAPCTVCRPDDFHSFRRDKRGSRMLALLSLERWPS